MSKISEIIEKSYRSKIDKLVNGFEKLNVPLPERLAIMKGKVAQIGEVHTYNDGSKWRKEATGWTQVVDEKKGKKKDKAAPKNGKSNVQAGDGKAIEAKATENLSKHAQSATVEQLKAAISTSKDPKVVEAAKRELSGRGVDHSQSQKKEESQGGQPAGKTGAGKDIKSPTWYGELNKQHRISPLPINIPQAEVEVYNGKDLDSHYIMKWKDPKSGIMQHAYTAKFHAKNAEIKWKRTSKLGGNKFLNDVHTKALAMMKSKDDKKSQVGAVLAIIAKTGLRVGSSSAFAKTGNQGVTTLKVESIKIDNDKVSFDFIGKSHKRNVTSIDDKELGDYLFNRMGAKEGSDALFDISRNDVINTFRNEFGYKNANIKDIRTVFACESAESFLFDKKPPPPVPKNQRAQDKLIKAILKECYNDVSTKLNNTPAMAQKSYINPNVVSKWLDSVGGQVRKAEDVVTDDELDETDAYLESDEDEIDDESYPLPEWWTEDEKRMGMIVEKEHQGTYDKLTEYVKQNGVLPEADEFFSWIVEDHEGESNTYYEDLIPVMGEDEVKKINKVDKHVSDTIKKAVHKFNNMEELDEVERKVLSLMLSNVIFKR